MLKFLVLTGLYLKVNFKLCCLTNVHCPYWSRVGKRNIRKRIVVVVVVVVNSSFRISKQFVGNFFAIEFSKRCHLKSDRKTVTSPLVRAWRTAPCTRRVFFSPGRPIDYLWSRQKMWRLRRPTRAAYRALPRVRSVREFFVGPKWSLLFSFRPPIPISGRISVAAPRIAFVSFAPYACRRQLPMLLRRRIHGELEDICRSFGPSSAQLIDVFLWFSSLLFGMTSVSPLSFLRFVRAAFCYADETSYASISRTERAESVTHNLVCSFTVPVCLSCRFEQQSQLFDIM